MMSLDPRQVLLTQPCFIVLEKMSLVIRIFAQVLGDLSPLPFPAVRAQILSPRVLSAPRLGQDWMGTFSVLPAGAVLSC